MTAVEVDNQSSIDQNSGFDTNAGMGSGASSMGDGFMGINTGNKVMDFIIGGLFPGLGVIDRLANFSWGDGVAGRGSSNDPTEQGASNSDLFERIINTLSGRIMEPTERRPTTANPRATQEGSRPVSTSRSSINYPSRGRSTLRRGPTMRPADLINMRSINDMLPSTDSVSSMLGTPEMPNLSQLFADKLRGANDAAVERSDGLMQLLNRGANRGDFAIDANTAAAVNPVLKQGRDQALSSMLSGSRVADNLFDLTNLRNDIGAGQGAQNINVRGRLPAMRSRRY